MAFAYALGCFKRYSIHQPSAGPLPLVGEGEHRSGIRTNTQKSLKLAPMRFRGNDEVMGLR